MTHNVRARRRTEWETSTIFANAVRDAIAALDGAGRKIVAVDRRYFRPAEVDTLLGDPSKAKQKLGWTARTSFEALVEEMTREDLREAERDALVKKHGHRVHNQHE